MTSINVSFSDKIEVEKTLAFRSAIDMGRNSGKGNRLFKQIISDAKKIAKISK